MRSHRLLVLAAALVTAPPVAAQSTTSPVTFTREQVDAGGRLYARDCAKCHGTRLDDGVADPLAGPVFQRRWSVPGKSLDDLHYVTSTTMPKEGGGVLSPADYLALLAYILERNGQAVGAMELTKSQLAGVRLIAPQRAATSGPRPTAPDFIRGDSGLIPRVAGPDQRDLLAGSPDGRDWLMHTRDFAGSRYSPLTQITTTNAAQLRPTCMFQVAEPGNFQTGPVVHDGVMYITSVASTIAIDAATCRQKWRHTWQPPTGDVRSFQNNRGVAIKDGRVMRGTTDGYLLAIGRDDGKLLWARRVTDPSTPETITMSPLVFDSLVFIGVAVSEYAVKGWVAAFRIDNGERVWRFNIVPAPGEPGSETWKQASDIPLGGGAVWTPLAIDATSELLFVAAANPAPDFPEAIRGGINLYTNSLIALHARTGKLAWYDQMVPNDDHDWDMTQVSPLYRARVDGAMRNLVATAGKDGVLRVVDRDSKRRVFEAPLTTQRNVEAPVTTAGTPACPGIFGGVQWNGPAHHPGLNLLAVPAVDWCTTFYLAEVVRFVPGQSYLGGRVTMDTAWGGWITAVDASTGKERWRYKSPAPVIGAVTATAGGLILAGELTGDFIALDAATGGVRYRFNTGGAIGGGVVTYLANGTQYVAVASGRPSSFWAKAYLGAPTIVVFSVPRPAGAR
jgi:alcohol dehydrogenase (cytochrome c)